MNFTEINKCLCIILGLFLIIGITPSIWAETINEETINEETINEETINEEATNEESGKIAETEIIQANELAQEVDAASVQQNTGQNNGITLYKGWNLVATPRTLEKTENRATVFNDVNTDGHSIWTYDSESKEWIDITQDETIRPLYGYWIYSTEIQWIPLTYNTDPVMVPPSRTLLEGWNLVGLAGIRDATARDAFLSVRKVWTNIMGWDEQKQEFEQVILNGGEEGNNEMNLLSTGNAYWVFVTESGVMAALDA
jgi:hypothetical protein